jgi:predicted flap endonuclease-1-like 5' DNA nuclease
MSKLIKTLKQKWNDWRNPPVEEQTEAPVVASATKIVRAGDPIEIGGTPLTDIVGIGPTRARKLNELGIANVERLAEMTGPILNSVSGINTSTCESYIAQAKEIRANKQ